MTRSPRTALLAGSVLLAASLASLPTQPAGAAQVAAFVRVDQVGYLPTDAKHAYLLSSAKVSAETFAVVDSTGRRVASGKIAATSRGRWNATYPAVYDIAFSGLRRAGRYRVVVQGRAAATSPSFVIEDAAAMYGRVLHDAVDFDHVQRDGARIIPGPLHRQSAHLHDRSATVYAWPHFEADSDTITDKQLRPIAGPVDVAGGWADAGDYLKFTHTAAYNDVVLYASTRNLGPKAPRALLAEAAYGSDWLAKMWNPKTKTLYLQVGIGTGNKQGSFLGDHDLWRLPQADDSDTADPYISHRPVFEAAPPGSKISPNLVGRVSAAFALAAQVQAAAGETAQARANYARATSLYAMAATPTPPKPLTTALPNEYYPESTWHDDMELGATEIALAAQLLHRPAGTYLQDATRWAKDYIAHDTGDTFNLYDTSALAHVDLVRAIARAGHPSGLALGRSALIADLRRQIRSGVQHAAADPFRAGGNYDDFDVDSHTFGLIASVGWYRAVTGDRSFDAFAAEQRDWLFGANAWGTSFMVGEGSTFPDCMQHQVANLDGSSDGQPPIDVGAVVNGPNGRDVFDPGGLGGYQDGMVHCPAGGVDAYRAFDGHGSRYLDDVRSWETDEPALDMTAGAIAASAAFL